MSKFYVKRVSFLNLKLFSVSVTFKVIHVKSNGSSLLILTLLTFTNNLPLTYNLAYGKNQNLTKNKTPLINYIIGYCPSALVTKRKKCKKNQILSLIFSSSVASIIIALCSYHKIA